MASKTARRAALALAGLALTGGAVVGVAGTAQAAAPASHSGSVSANGWGWNGDDDEVIAVFRSYRQCQWAGIRGERHGNWEEFDCDYVRSGYRGHWRQQWGNPFNRHWEGGNWRYRGVWVLRAERCDD
jgi:hypothetical protein